MKYDDYRYFIRKMDEYEHQKLIYEDAFSRFLEWLEENREHLDKLPVSERPILPVEVPEQGLDDI